MNTTYPTEERIHEHEVASHIRSRHGHRHDGSDVSAVLAQRLLDLNNGILSRHTIDGLRQLVARELLDLRTDTRISIVKHSVGTKRFDQIKVFRRGSSDDRETGELG